MFTHRSTRPLSLATTVFSSSVLASAVLSLAGLAVAQEPRTNEPITKGVGPEDRPGQDTTRTTDSPLGGLTGPGDAVPQGEPRPMKNAPPAAPTSWLVPIHTGAADPEGGAYGTWAAGPDYKVSFHDGFAFYPVLGTAYPRNLPLRWQTVSVKSGTAELMTSQSPVKHAAPWRFEYRFGGMTEAYDVKTEGVEQTFVFHRKPQGIGDLVVTGRITSELTARPRGAAHKAIEFKASNGAAILTYGKAFAFDAEGRRTTVTTSFDGQNIRLILSGAWLEHASYPVTIDPLTSRKKIATWGLNSFGQPSYPDVARDDETNELLTSYSRASSASDYDTFARITTDEFGSSVKIFTDVTASWSTRYNQCCFVGGADRWAIALGRNFTSTSGVRVYFHDKNDKVLNSGTVLFLSRPTGFQDQHPSIGGTAGFVTGTNAYLAFRRDQGTGAPNNSDSKVYGVTVDLSGTGSFGTQKRLDVLAAADEHWPCVSKQSYGGDWVVVWQGFNNSIANDDWDAIAMRVSKTGALINRSFFGPASSATHKLVPKIAGSGGRFLASFTQRKNTNKTSSVWGDEISDQRADWSGAGAPAKKDVQTLASSLSNTLTTGSGNRGIGYDSNTDSHWAVAYHTNTWNVYVQRVGHNGCAVERRTVYNTSSLGFSPSIVYNDDGGRFAIVFGTNETPTSNQPVYGVNFDYQPTALCVTYGSGCAGNASCDNRGLNNNPYAGSEFFEIELTSGIPNKLYSLFVSTAPASVPLGGGCTLNLGGPLYLIHTGPTNAAGRLTVPAPLPDCPAFIGTVYGQFFTIQNGMLKSSRGVRIAVR